MFGYVTPYKPELKIKDYELFKAYYCGLCHSIKELYGNIPRMSLNYDMTFLAILLSGLDEQKDDFIPFKCGIHPFKKRARILNCKALIYSAHMNVALTYYKYIDDKNDDKTLKSYIGSTVFNKYLNKYMSTYNELYLDIFYHLKELDNLECDLSVLSIDELSHNFNIIIAKIMSFYSSDSYEKEVLYDLGYNLGKWIYILDALDDLKKDMDTKKFNALNFLYNKYNKSYEEFFLQIKEKSEFLLISCSSQCVLSLNKLNLKKNKELIYNVIEFGLMDKMQNVLKGAEINDKSI